MVNITYPDKHTLSNYKDWLHKAIYDFNKYRETFGVYELADCLLTLNALREWIAQSSEAPPSLKIIAWAKIAIMKTSNGFVFDENKLDKIDQKLRFVRIFCNHSKHSERKDKFPEIEMSFTLPATFPAAFENIKIGTSYFKAEAVLSDVVDFWTKSIEQCV